MAMALVEEQRTQQVARLQTLVDDALADLVLDNEPIELYEPVRYVLGSKGKRLRPLLLMLSAEAHGFPVEKALPGALAVEVFHAFTLVHDDIMDHAATRRGRATVHTRWDESTAILCGDLLLALSYDLLSRVDTPALPSLLRAYYRMVARLCEGQALDKAFEQRSEVTVGDYLEMIDRKTGALLEVSLVLGGMMAGASEGRVGTLRQIGRHVGRAFQIQDDLLDLTATDVRWGKTTGGDLVEGKKTYLLLRTLEMAGADDRAWFARVLHQNGLAAAEVPEARARMERIGVLTDAVEAIAAHTRSARSLLAQLGPSESVLTLQWLIEQMGGRRH